MSNLLVIPLKRSEPSPIRQALRAYIQQKHPETHPDAFTWDITKWETYRKEAVTTEIHESRIAKAIAYHAQLAFILTKLPPDVGLSFTYDAMFTSGSPLTLANTSYERVSLLLNISALYCQLGAAEDRSTIDGIKRAVAYFTKGAGVISYLISTGLPQFRRSLQHSNADTPIDFDEMFLKSLQYLLLGQAQECAWQKAMMDQMKNGLLAKLASQVSSFYSQALGTLDGRPVAANNFPRGWIPHIEAKMNHFEAVAQFRQSLDDNMERKYGLEISRIGIALVVARKALDLSRKLGVSRSVQEDSKSFVSVLQAADTEARKLNDLIYHQDVPPASSTPSISGSAVVVPNTPAGLKDPASAIGGGKSENLIFGGLEGWGIRRACEIYVDLRDNWIHDEVIQSQHDLDKAASRALNEMNLPSSLDVLSQPIGLPPSLLRKAAQVRREDGPARMSKIIDDIPKLAARCRAFVDEALDLLDEEMTEDEEYQRAYARYDKWDRAPSEQANSTITAEAKKYHQLLDQAAKSDALVRHRWEEWEEQIRLLAQDEATIESTVPKTTGREVMAASRSGTKVQARGLRKLLEDLEDLQEARGSIVSQARRLAATDDIKPQILRQALSLEAWKEIDPAIFDGVIEQQLSKYERFKQEIGENSAKQEGLLARITEQNELFLQSRKDDPATKSRERSLQSLDQAHQKYQETTKDLEDGLKFYNDLATQLAGFRAVANEWVDQRRAEVQWLIDSLNPILQNKDGAGLSATNVPKGNEIARSSLSLKSPSQGNQPSQSRADPEPEDAPAAVTSAPAARPVAVKLPNPFSGAWEPTPDIVPPTSTGQRGKTKARRGSIATK